MANSLKVGDTVWYHNGSAEKIPGKIIKILTLPNYGKTIFYIIESPSHIEPILEIRQYELVSDAKNKPLFMWRNLKDTTLGKTINENR